MAKSKKEKKKKEQRKGRVMSLDAKGGWGGTRGIKKKMLNFQEQQQQVLREKEDEDTLTLERCVHSGQG